MNLNVQCKADSRKFKVDLEFLGSQYSTINSLYTLAVENDEDEFTLNISNIKGMTLDLFAKFLDICNKVEMLIAHKREELKSLSKEKYENLNKEILRRRDMVAKKYLTPEQCKWTGEKFIEVLEAMALKHYGNKIFVNMPKTKKGVYNDVLKEYIHTNHHKSDLFVEYAKIGKPLIYIINLSHFLGDGEATYHMGAYMLYIYVTDTENSNKVYEDGKQYNPNEVFYEDPVKNKAYHAGIQKKQKLLNVTKHFRWTKHIDLSKFHSV
jgi:hypothetical protein